MQSITIFRPSVFFSLITNVKFHENPVTGPGAFSFQQTDGRTDFNIHSVGMWAHIRNSNSSLATFMSYFWAIEGKFHTRNYLPKRYTNGAEFTIASEALTDGEVIDYPWTNYTRLRRWRRAHTASYAYIPILFAQTWRYNCSRMQRDVFALICAS